MNPLSEKSYAEEKKSDFKDTTSLRFQRFNEELVQPGYNPPAKVAAKNLGEPDAAESPYGLKRSNLDLLSRTSKAVSRKYVLGSKTKSMSHKSRQNDVISFGGSSFKRKRMLAQDPATKTVKTIKSVKTGDIMKLING